MPLMSSSRLLGLPTTSSSPEPLAETTEAFRLDWTVQWLQKTVVSKARVALVQGLNAKS